MNITLHKSARSISLRRLRLSFQGFSLTTARNSPTVSVRRATLTNGMVERFCGRIEDIVQQTCFESASQLEESLIMYLHIYHSNIPQRNLSHITPAEMLEKWRKTHPELFKKMECNHLGLDIQEKS